MENEKEPTGSASERPGLATGAFVAAMLTASLISVFYLAWKAAGLPFVPFDVFDWMNRILPGQVIAVGIGAMVTVIRGAQFRADGCCRQNGRARHGDRRHVLH